MICFRPARNDGSSAVFKVLKAKGLRTVARRSQSRIEGSGRDPQTGSSRAICGLSSLLPDTLPLPSARSKNWSAKPHRAFEVLASLDSPPAATVQIIGLVANAVGTVEGMIGGQVLDLESEHHKPTPELLQAIHRAKTGALIRVSVSCTSE